MLTEDDIERIVTRVMERQLAPIAETLELTTQRLLALDQRIMRIELRLARLTESVTRGLTTDLERITALETRVEELERLLAARHD